MKPNDKNGRLPAAERPFRILIISGSDRRQYNCPGVDSKSRALMLRMAGRLPEEWEIDYENLGNVYGRARIQSCNACVSTSMAPSAQEKMQLNRDATFRPTESEGEKLRKDNKA